MVVLEKLIQSQTELLLFITLAEVVVDLLEVLVVMLLLQALLLVVKVVEDKVQTKVLLLVVDQMHYLQTLRMLVKQTKVVVEAVVLPYLVVIQSVNEVVKLVVKV
jgi:hypothetical protein